MRKGTERMPLTKGKFAVVDAEDHGWLSQWKWSAMQVRRTTGDTWYARRAYGPRGHQTVVLMHRQIMNAPHGIDVDHENGDGLDNRRTNMRLATRIQNGQNRRNTKAGKTSRWKGVNWHKRSKKYRAEIGAGPRRADGCATGVFLGLLSNEDDAARAYDAAAKIYFGDRAALNFPEGE